MHTTSCSVQHDPFGTLLGVFLLAGLVISALPQIIRMVRKGNSFGYSPWFLLLGSTSSASAWVNVVALQWGVVRCCPTLGVGLCLEGLLGAIQVGVQWGLGFLLFCLFLHYFPREERYLHRIALPDTGPDSRLDTDEDEDEGEHAGHASRASLDPRASILPSARPNGNSHEDTPPRAPAHSPAVSRADPQNTLASETIHPFPGPTPTASKPRISSTPSALRWLRQGVHPTTCGTKTSEWKLAIALIWVAIAHLACVGLITLVLVLSLPDDVSLLASSPLRSSSQRMAASSISSHEPSLASFPSSTLHPTPSLTPVQFRPDTLQLLHYWTTILGFMASALATAQYLPQLWYTATRRLVGSLSIGTMMLQTPGTVLFIYSLAMRPGVNWTGIMAYGVKGTLQGTLLLLCFACKVRQRRLGIDDFGHLLVLPSTV